MARNISQAGQQRLVDLNQYCFLMANASRLAIVAFTLRHDITTPERVIVHESHYGDPNHATPPSALRPGESVLLTPSLQLNAEARLTGNAAWGSPRDGGAEAREQATYFSQQLRIAGSVDSIIYENGLVTGRDRAQSRLRYQAFQQAEDTLAREVIARITAGSDKSALQNWLQNKERPRGPLGGNVDPAFHHQLRLAQFAETLVRQCEHEPLEKVKEMLSSFLVGRSGTTVFMAQQ